MSHLGPRVSAYVDGQLPAAEIERAHAHLAVCPECQAEVMAEGAGRRAARQARPVQAGDELTTRLLALGSAPEQDYLPAGAAPGSSSRGGSGLKVLTGALASLSIVAASLFVLGGTQREIDVRDLTASVGQAGTDQPGSVQAGSDQAGSDQTNSTSGAANGAGESKLSGTVLEWMRSSGWAAPRQLPNGMSVQEVRSTTSGADTVRIALAGQQGEVSVVERHGVLSESATEAMDSAMIDGRAAYRLGDNVWVVQCGDAVVAVSSPNNPAAARAVIADMPTEDSLGVLDRMMHGFDVLVGRE